MRDLYNCVCLLNWRMMELQYIILINLRKEEFAKSFTCQLACGYLAATPCHCYANESNLCLFGCFTSFEIASFGFVFIIHLRFAMTANVNSLVVF